MKKLLLILSAIDIGGGQRFCMNLCKYLNAIKYDYNVLFLRKGTSKELRQEFIDNHINFFELNCKSVMRAIPRIVLYANKMKPDVILSTIGNVDFAVTIAKLFIPKTKFYIRKANVLFESQRCFINIFKLKLEALVCKKMIALTREMKEDYIQYGFKEEKIFVINNMVDLDYIDQKIKKSCEKCDWFDGNQFKVIIANARMVPEKRYDILIKAFEIICNSHSEVRLIIIGDGPLRKQIEKMVPVEIIERVRFLGFQNNPYYYMSHANVFVLTSDYEGFPNVLIEALACGLPAVTTDCKTGPKEIIENGVDGWVVGRGNAEAIAMRIEQLLNDPIELDKLSRNARKKAQFYRTDFVAKQYIQLLNDEMER